jgi:hypothetical protein
MGLRMTPTGASGHLVHGVGTAAIFKILAWRR